MVLKVRSAGNELAISKALFGWEDGRQFSFNMVGLRGREPGAGGGPAESDG